MYTCGILRITSTRTDNSSVTGRRISNGKLLAVGRYIYSLDLLRCKAQHYLEFRLGIQGYIRGCGCTDLSQDKITPSYIIYLIYETLGARKMYG